ncbi:uncharacterized protein EI97DRAFT_446491 [Westerdykella ornata]|uniref:Histone acetyltransferase n=1 Tax=Westerdykella ornata TaxID=318751 RepID=A0A6A6J5X0_WESOR|nr:uncharacterized protein EI97DRAFT_446491 [Westerdykella ornata]KAF2271587.1 hypothetical protein EI97DRAFT_446491 [Westerdykella ornata]
MPEPVRFMGQAPTNASEDENDIDGEYEEDDMTYDQVGQASNRDEGPNDAEDSDLDAEGEEIDDEEDHVGAVKVPEGTDALSEEDEENDVDDLSAVDTASDAKTSEAGESVDGSSESSEAENDWQGESEDGEDSGEEHESSNDCTFCGNDEENDPSEEFEEYLTCRDCGDHAHRQCARNANTLSSDEDAQDWRCLACLQNAKLSGAQDSEVSPSGSRVSTVPKLARDLLPSQRGAGPASHSMFNHLILPDDPLDGSRSLRKRKSSLDDEEHSVRQTRKKRRSSEFSRSEAGAASLRNATGTDNDTDGEGIHPSASEHGSLRLRSTRSRQTQPKRTDKRPLVWIEEESGLGPLSLVVVFHLNNEKVQKIVTAKPKKKIVDPRLEARRERDRERRDRNRRATQQQPASPEFSHYPSIQTYPVAPFYGFVEKEMDESKNKPYGGILSEAEADTSKTYPTQADRKRFEDARLKAEEDWKQKQAREEPQPKASKSVPSKIKCINFGGWEIDTWHAAPYPEEYSKNRILYICEFCLKYMASDYVAWRHKLKCPAKHPPGDEIYRDGKYSFFEVDGRKNPVYCQNLCLLAKLFLGSKTLYYDVEPFLFYVMTENDSYGCHFVGYFSKEKRSSSMNNVSCILVLPIHMRKGYGQYLIEFSYLLTRKEKKTGSPEKPLSDMGLVSYRKYWRLVLCEELLHQKGPISIAAISERTGMTPDDIVSALEGLRALVRDPVTKTYALRLDYAYFRQYIEKCNANNNPKIKPECLVWTPYVQGRLGQYEDGPAMHTVQQRDEPLEEAKPAMEEETRQLKLAEGKNGVSKETLNNSKSAVKAADEQNSSAVVGKPFGNGESPAPSTPLANGSTSTAGESEPGVTAIPPTRYEIFPPVPGLPSAKRRPGRPFGSRRRTSTPNRSRQRPLSITTAPVPRMQLSPNKNGNGAVSPSVNASTTAGINLRRTRSQLGKSVINGINGDDSGDGGAVKPMNGIVTRRTRSYTGSPRDVVGFKGKGGAIQGGQSAVDDEAGSDLDADGELDDIDAEGEEDDMADVMMANA